MDKWPKLILRVKYPYSKLFLSECGKMLRVTPNTDTFYVV